MASGEDELDNDAMFLGCFQNLLRFNWSTTTAFLVLSPIILITNNIVIFSLSRIATHRVIANEH
ncbi:hypothetical protein C1H46_034556 [Malus baccata]|uniref:Uncharacterized protein n=1 Tax=Malus baccata TaxID=106549 RepID=A0A540L075_MALBA|nr:hypothetical protein C1H46_034556 [Malus baccata]